MNEQSVRMRLLRLTAVTLFVPFFIIGWYFVPRTIGLNGIGTFAIAFYLFGMLLLLGTRYLRQGLQVFLVGFLLILVSPTFVGMGCRRTSNSGDGQDDPSVVSTWSREQGDDVYCNGVYLGRTPLRISQREFFKRVPAWDTPPEQNILADQRHAPSHPVYGSVDYLGPAKKSVGGYHQYAQGLIVFDTSGESSKYWWYFERDGCMGLIRRYGQGIVYPSQEPHLRLVLRALRQRNYQPTPEWIAHVRKYPRVLFPALIEHAEKEPGILPALQSVVREELGIYDGMTAADVNRVFDDLMRRIEDARIFVTPSLESMAIDLLDGRIAASLERWFVRAARLPVDGKSSQRRIDETGWFYTGDDIAALQGATGYAIQQHKPPELFPRLMHERYSSEQRPYLIANYPNHDAVRYLRSYLKGAMENSVFRQVRQYIAQGTVPYVHNPALEADVKRFVDRVVRSDSHHLSVFIGMRLGSQDAHTEWFLGLVLESDKRLTYLPRLQLPQVEQHVREAVGDDSRRRDRVIHILKEHPNPYLDSFLIDSYTHDSEYPNLPLLAVVEAMQQSDSPVIRAFLADLWTQGEEQQRIILGSLHQFKQGDPSLARWCSRIAEVTERSLRFTAIDLLSVTDTPEAAAVLERWSQDEDRGIRELSREQLQGYQQRDQVAADLIEGRIHPDELIPLPPSHMWDAQQQGYVRVTGVNQSD